ncbi:MAG TPA: DUF2169 domain-containing protein, partial [Candidatus Nanopelagicales bacterium]|nr:DUF2169 domain-containing protein [Candidatus Nanopelagicales bacterium]
MRLSAECPLPVTSLVWKPRPDAFALTVVCKATFNLHPGRSPLAAIQEMPLQADVAWEHGVAGSLSAASDCAPFKRRVDVVLVGYAHAPYGKRAAVLPVRLAVGGVDKQIDVHGDRFWMPDGRLTNTAPFTRMSLRWERAARGPGGWNPAGVQASELQPAPNLLPPGFVLTKPTDAVPATGFGPIAATWPERARWLHRRGAARPHEPLPGEVDAAFFNVAPPDQQIDELAPDAHIVLEHMHPAHPRLATSLSVVTPRAWLERPGEAQKPIDLRCDTLWIDTDRELITLTFRGIAPLRHAGEQHLLVVVVDLPAGGDPEEEPTLVPTRTAPEPPPEPPPEDEDEEPTLIPRSPQAAARPARSDTTQSAPLQEVAAPPLPFRRPTLILPPSEHPADAALPFRQVKEPAPPAAGHARAVYDDALPFRAPPAPPPTPLPPTPLPPTPRSRWPPAPTTASPRPPTSRTSESGPPKSRPSTSPP